MRIAFHAPLKPPGHPVPSGDRLMARLLMRALAMAGHEVVLVSDLRPFLRDPHAGMLAAFQTMAEAEARAIAARWRREGAPDLWFTYHPYYKAPDLLGPRLAREFGLPYVTAESSWSSRRNDGDWGAAQDLVRAGLAQAALNLCLTARDLAGIRAAEPGARVARLPPFIDAAPFAALPPAPRPGHLVAVAMMRPGDKLSSHLALAHALARIGDRDWHLTLVGDGPARSEVEAAFAPFARRVTFTGALPAEAVARVLSTGAIHVWPGHGEAYGLAYLEAQAAGLPVVAEATAGVPEVVEDGRTGLLTPERDPEAFAAAVALLLDDPVRRTEMALAARDFVLAERSLEGASARLGRFLADLERKA